MRFTEEEYEKLIARRGATPAARPTLQSVIDKANADSKAPLEDQEQLALVNWLRFKGIRFHHSPNGGLRNAIVAKKLKAQGVSPGFPDLIIFPVLASGLPILLVELKRQKGGTVSDSQREWIDYINELFCTGYPIQAAVCRGFNEAREFIESRGYR